jgi:hypothetical protein
MFTFSIQVHTGDAYEGSPNVDEAKAQESAAAATLQVLVGPEFFFILKALCAWVCVRAQAMCMRVGYACARRHVRAQAMCMRVGMCARARVV